MALQNGRRPRVWLLAALLVLGQVAPGPDRTLAAATATDCCGDRAAWTTGNKDAIGTSATTASTVWFTIANGITTEVFYPRADMPDMQDMQYVVTDGMTFVDVEREATDHRISMPDELSLEYTIVNTAKSGRYRLTHTYVVDPDRNTLVINTRFESLDNGTYLLYVRQNASTAGDAFNDAMWDPAQNALLSSNTQTLFGPPIPVVSALESSRPFIAHTNGYAGAPSDCLVDIRAHKGLTQQVEAASTRGNTVQCGQIGVGTDTTFALALGFGPDAVAASAAANASLVDGFSRLEAKYRSGWHAYLSGLKPAPLSVSNNERRRRAYYVGVMALHAAEDKTHPGASVAGLATPWGDLVDGSRLNDGYHRVWGRDLYQQATGLLAAGDSAQALRMAQFLWNNQYVSTPTPGDNTTYVPGSFPRYSPVSGVSDAAPQLLGCCEQFDQDAFAILLAWTTGLTDPFTYARIKTTANHIVDHGPDTRERWEELDGKSPSSVAAEIAGLIAAADIARLNADTTSASKWEATADTWRDSLVDWTFTTSGAWGNHQYFQLISSSSSPDDNSQICNFFQEGCFNSRDIVDFGFLELVRLGVRPANDEHVLRSLGPSATAYDGNSSVRVELPNGDVYFHRYVHDNYGESNVDCSGWPNGGDRRFGRLWPLLSGERGEYELANSRSANVYLQSMADAANVGYFMPEQIWDRSDVACYQIGRPTGSASPLMWAEGQYVRLAQAIDRGSSGEAPPVVLARYGGQVSGPLVGNAGKCVNVSAARSANGTPVQLSDCTGADAQQVTWNTGDGALHVLGRCLDVTASSFTNGTRIQLWDCNGSPAQQWAYLPWNRIQNPPSGRCLADPSGNATNAPQLELQDCNSWSAQIWTLP